MAKVDASVVWERILRLEAEAFELRNQLHLAAKVASWYREGCHDIFFKTLCEGNHPVEIEHSFRDSVWVLSMCHVSEGGGDVIPAELFATEQDALNAVARYKRSDSMFVWGCVDYTVDEADIPPA